MPISRTEAFIPSPAVAEITLEGVTFRISVEGLPLYFERLIPELLAGDEDRSLLAQGKTVAPDLRWHRVPDQSWPHPSGRPLVDYFIRRNEELVVHSQPKEGDAHAC